MFRFGSSPLSLLSRPRNAVTCADELDSRVEIGVGRAMRVGDLFDLDDDQVVGAQRARVGEQHRCRPARVPEAPLGLRRRLPWCWRCRGCSRAAWACTSRCGWRRSRCRRPRARSVARTNARVVMGPAPPGGRRRARLRPACPTASTAQLRPRAHGAPRPVCSIVSAPLTTTTLTASPKRSVGSPTSAPSRICPAATARVATDDGPIAAGV